MIHISCKFTGRGWIEATLLTEEKEVTIRATYFSDAPNDLIVAVALLLEGANETMCKWQEEPGEYRWIFKRDNNLVNIQVFQVEQSFSKKNNKSGIMVFADKEDLYLFTRQILNEFNTITFEFNSESYKNNWGYEFPLSALNRLKKAIKNVSG